MEWAVSFPVFHNGLHAGGWPLPDPVGAAIGCGEIFVLPIGIVQNLADLLSDCCIRLHGRSVSLFLREPPDCFVGSTAASSQ
jgi:hypothetical protein